MVEFNAINAGENNIESRNVLMSMDSKPIDYHLDELRRESLRQEAEAYRLLSQRPATSSRGLLRRLAGFVSYRLSLFL